MKISELKNPQLNEGALGEDLDVYSAGLKSMFQPGVTQQAQLQSDLFLKDFVADAIVSLQNAVKSGIVVPGAATPAGQNTMQPKTTPVGKNAASADPYENLKGQMRRLQPKTGAKPLPDNFATELNIDMAKLAKGDKESGTRAANKILKFANSGYDVSELAPIWNASSKASERFLTQSVYRAIANMLREHGLTWDNLGLRNRLYEGAGNSGVFLSRCSPIPVASPEFKKMDLIFEGIITELFEGQSGEADQSISTYLMTWFGKWMKGVDWEGRRPQVQSLISAIETNYPKGNWKGAIQQLAKAAYAISAAGSTSPEGLANAAAKPTDGKVAADAITDFGVSGGSASKPGQTSAAQGADAEEELKALVKADPRLAQKYNIKV
jgi:hypothetical protein